MTRARAPHIPAAGDFEPRDAPPNWRPIPDPTVLTTQQLLRELFNLKELVETRMNAYDKAIALLQDYANRQPTIGELSTKVTEKFEAIQLQFHERDLRFDRAGVDQRLAVEAAFAAAKEAVGKSEATFIRQIEGILALMNTASIAANDKIDELRNRLTAMEGRGQAYSQGFGWIVSAITVAAAIAGAVAALLFRGA